MHGRGTFVRIRVRSPIFCKSVSVICLEQSCFLTYVGIRLVEPFSGLVTVVPSQSGRTARSMPCHSGLFRHWKSSSSSLAETFLQKANSIVEKA